jgi:hypothetical protein
LEYSVSGTNHAKSWATLGFATGIVASIAANVAHSFVPPPDAAHWHPQLGAIVFAGFWPVALLIAIEVIARVVWPHGKWWKFVRHVGLVLVAAIAAIISYRHMSGLLAYYGEDHLSSAIGPLAVDGLMAVCTAALLATTQNQAAETPADGLSDAPEGDGVALEAATVLEAPGAATRGRRPRRGPGNFAKRTSRQRNARAEAAYAASLDTDTPLTYQEIAEQYGDGRGERWARDRQIAVRRSRQDQAA